MFQNHRIAAILLMGGEGRRLEGEVPKQFQILAGKPMYCHALDTMIATGLFDEIVLVCHSAWMHLFHEGCRVVAAGQTRQQSCYYGLKSLQHTPDIVLIHDAARPFVTERILRENVAGAIAWGAVDTCIPTADTLVHAPGGRIIASIPVREEYWRGQTPQTFRWDWIWQAHEDALRKGIGNTSDDCRLVLQIGRPVHVVAGDERNFKITSKFDLLLAESCAGVYESI